MTFLSTVGLPAPSAIVGSGGGLHVYWISHVALSPAEWHPYADGLKHLLLQYNIKCDAGLTTDAARLLRVPGTMNFKYDPPQPVRLLNLPPVSYDFAAALGFLTTLAPVTVAVTSTHLPNNPFVEGIDPSSFGKPAFIVNDGSTLGAGIKKREFGPLDPRPVFKQCAFMRNAFANGGADYDNPLWNLGVLATTFMENGKVYAHEISKGHATYAAADTQALYDRKVADRADRGVGWPSCATIQSNGCKACQTCPHFTKGKSPLNLTYHKQTPPAESATPLGQPTSSTAASGDVEGVSVNDFYAYMPTHHYIYIPTRDPWPASSVDSRIEPIPLLGKDGKPKLGTVPASKWLDCNRPIEQMTWAPGFPELIQNRLVAEGGWIERPNVACLNLYRPPTIEPGNAAEADLWIDHLDKIYPNDAEHITRYLAHRVQFPGQKINHALMLGGSQGIGKDTLLEPVKHAVGPWNFSEVSPQSLTGRFTGFYKSVIIRVSEARDLGDVSRYSFYEHMKTLAAAPPDVLRCDEKNLREHTVMNVCGIIITTNHKTDGIYLPADDRRHYVAWSDLTKEDFVKDYWRTLWGWYECGGLRHVAAYLAEYDLSNFDPKAPPPKTAAFYDIVDANRAPEEAELSDIFDRLKNPDAVTLIRITNEATGEFEGWLKDRKNRRAIPHRLEKCGYAPVRSNTKEGLWIINGTRQVVYARSDLSLGDQIKAAQDLVKQGSCPKQ